MKRFLLYLVITIGILYVFKVPEAVKFVNNILETVIPVWNGMLDMMLHFSERHPILYILILPCLLYLMRPQYNRS